MADTPDYVNGEPKPVHNFNPSIHDLLVNDAQHMVLGFMWNAGLDDFTRNKMIDLFRERKAYGFRKYGTILQAENGRDFFKDAIEETIDQLAYLRQGLSENPQNKNLLEAYRLAVAVLRELLKFQARRAQEKQKPEVTKTSDDQGRRFVPEGEELGTAAAQYNTTPIPEGKVPCNCLSGSECGGTGFKNA